MMLAGEVNVRPPEAGGFGSAEAGVELEAPERLEAFAGDGRQETAGLVGGPHRAGGGGRRGRALHRGHWVPREEAVGDGILEGSMEDPMGQTDGSGR
jgi:hypothetical protein